MTKDEVELCTEVVGLFENFKYEGNVAEMVQHTATLQKFGRMIAIAKKKLSEAKIEPTEEQAEA